MNNKRIFVVGSLNQDIVATVDRAPTGGETIFGSSLAKFPGGKGANQAVAAQLYSSNAVFVGRGGEDSFAEDLVAYLNSTGLDVRCSLAPGGNTGTAIIIVENSGENRIVVIPGENFNVSTDDLGFLEELGEGDVVVVQNEINFEATHFALKKAYERNATTVFNIAPSNKINKDVLQYVDFLVLNESEFTDVFGDENSNDMISSVLRESKNCDTNIILTLGSKGLVASIDGQEYKLDGYTVPVVDTTGAGDCFVGALASGIACSLAPKDFLVFANSAAALSVGRAGASSSFVAKHVVDEFIEKQK